LHKFGFVWIFSKNKNEYCNEPDYIFDNEWRDLGGWSEKGIL
jgi:hypothetical protein